MKADRKKITYVIYCAITAFCVLLICSRSSFLYPYNIWDDANGFFTMGKSMLHGLVPYRDLFEPKGILLYVLYALGYLMSHYTFAGVFVLEIAAATAVLYFALRILMLYVNETLASVLTPIAACLVYSSRCFYWGGSAEEFMLPFLMTGLYLLLKHIHDDPTKALSVKNVFIGGLCAGCILHIKFNSLGFYIGWVIAVIVLIIMSDEKLRLRTFFISALAFLAGVLVITLPFVIYFAIHGALGDWFRCCVYDNVFIYSRSLPLGERIYQMCKTVYNQMLSNKRFSLMIALGIVIDLIYTVMKRDRRNALICLTDVLACGFLTMGVFIGGIDLPYYPLPISVFVVIGLARLGMVMESLWSRFRHTDDESGLPHPDKPRILKAVSVPVSLACAVAVCYFGSMNSYDIGSKQEDLYIYKFRDYIMSKGIEHPILLNMGSFDAGLYTLCDSIPECYYYQTTTMDIPGVWETQKDYVKSGRADFVLSCCGYLDFDTSGYEVVMQEIDDRCGAPTEYWLYEKVRE